MSDVDCFNFTELEDRFVSKLEKLVFRRVRDVNLKGPVTVHQFTPYGPLLCELSMELKTEGTEYRCPSGFNGWTVTDPINNEVRTLDDYIGYSIQFDSTNYAEIDIVQEGTFDMKYLKNDVFPHSNKNTKLYPDIICGMVKKNTEGQYYFEKWFICSSQFLRLWTFVMLPECKEVYPPVNKTYPNVTKKYDKLSQLKKWMTSGDRLNVNNFTKWLVSNKIDLNSKETLENEYLQKEIVRRYHRTRTESISRMWVHTYTALAMMIRFNTMPSNNNIPHNIDGETMGYWDLPPLFCERLLGIAEREVDEDDDEEITFDPENPFEGCVGHISIEELKRV
jgi:hypothetical protein